MRIATVVAVVCLLSGCSVLDKISMSGQTLNLNKIYLGKDVIRTGRFDDRSRYACVGGVLLCESAGVSWECRCP